MDRFIQITCFLCLMLGISFAKVQSDFSHKDHQQVYNINALLKNILLNVQSSRLLKDGKHDFVLREVHENFFNEASEKINLQSNSSQCAWDISYIAVNLKELWALRMLDSFGKPESGFLAGNSKWIGDYTECLDVYAPPNNAREGNFHGQYCSLSVILSVNTSLSVTLGVCIPDSCSSSQFEGDALQYLNPVVDVSSLDMSEAESSPKYKFQCQQRERHMNGPAQAVVALMSVFCALALIGSSITVVKFFMETAKDTRKSSLTVNISPDDLGANSNDLHKKDMESDDDLLLLGDTSGKFSGLLKKTESVFECFCVFKNGAKLLNTDTREGELLCIHGIRFLSMSWVILGHSYIFGTVEIRNLLNVLDLVKNWPFQILLQAFYSVDSFFVLSGFLLTYLCMQELSKKDGRINWPYFYIHRYLRLTPVYMIVLGFSATVYLYLGSGPFWPQIDIDPNCKENWWWNLLYINNFNTEATQCMGWSWYLANDMQFFVISPIILITLWRWQKVGCSILAALLCACWISNFYLTYHYDMLTGMASLLTQPSIDIVTVTAKFSDFFNKIYVKPYTRIAPYLIGMLTGYILYERKRSNAPKHSMITLCLGWAVATTITLACVYGLYQQNPGLVGKSFYNTLSRTTWAMGLCWVIYVCLIDQGGFVNSILSYKFFIPLSRLTYSAYLIHPMIISGYYGSLRTTFEFTHPSVVMIFLGVMVVTYALSLPVALVFESPIISLEKLIRKSFSKQY